MAVAVGSADDGDGAVEAVVMVVVAQGAYNSSTSLLKNGLASSREKLCECSRPTSRRERRKWRGSPRIRGGKGKPGIRKPWPRLRCLDLAWLGSALCTPYVFKPICEDSHDKKSEREEVSGIYIGNACAGRGGTRG